MQTTKASKTKKKPCPMHSPGGEHPNHIDALPRLKRIRGQVDGIERMISEQRYCVDILTQIKAARSALHALEGEVLRTHLESCVRDAIHSKDAFQADKKIKELMELLAR